MISMAYMTKRRGRKVSDIGDFSANEEANEALADIEGIELLPLRIERRKAFASASGAGLYIE